MNPKQLPLSENRIREICREIPTPFHLYDEQAIRKNARNIYKAFDWVPGGFKNFFAVKALPNPVIMNILKEEGMGTDCSSLPEMILSEKIGLSGEDIMFSSNDTPAHEYEYARKIGAIINLDDISHIPFLEKTCGLPDLICMRFNPGALKEGNSIIGDPEDAKYGATRDQIVEGYRTLKEQGVKRFGLHTMVASNELDPDYFIETARILFDIADEIKKLLDIDLEFINLGGGIGIPYLPEQDPVDLEYVSNGIRELYFNCFSKPGYSQPRIVLECGRVITGPYGYLFSKAIHRKETYKTFIGLDSCMANLMRPALYGAYHHISVVSGTDGNDNRNSETETVDVTGSLCENNDKFAINRTLPRIETEDIVIIHDTGAHGHAMGFNYNGKLRSAEYLLTTEGKIKKIRRAETIDDYLITLDFSDL